jgi:hypothetical protein
VIVAALSGSAQRLGSRAQELQQEESIAMASSEAVPGREFSSLCKSGGGSLSLVLKNGEEGLIETISAHFISIRKRSNL